jgi:hypothetical protein
LSKKAEILSLIETQEDLSRLTRNRSLSYVKKFFAILEDEALFKAEVLDRCRGRERLEAMLEAEAAAESEKN